MREPITHPSQRAAPEDHVHKRAYLDSVDTLAIQDSAVTAAKIAPDAIGTSELADNAVDTNAIANLAVTAGKIANDTITAGQVAANAITSSELADNAVDAAAIATGAVTATKINVPCVRAVWSANTLINNDSFAAVAFGGTDEYDTDTMHNPAANNTRITFTTAGIYSVGGWWEMELDQQGARGIEIRKNGTTRISGFRAVTSTFAGAGTDVMAIEAEAKFAAADYVELLAYNIASGSNLNIIAGAFWACYQTVG